MRRILTLKQREAITGYICIAPTVLYYLVFMVFPVVFALYLSFHQWGMFTSLDSAHPYVGLAYYRRALSDPEVWKALGRIFLYMLAGLPLGIAAGMGTALLMNQKIRGVVVYRTAFFLPMIASGAAVALVWRTLLSTDYGVVNYLLNLAGLPSVGWLDDERAAIFTRTLMSIWSGVGGGMIYYLAGLQGIPETLYEAAKIDGAGPWARFRLITFPLLAPVTFFLVVTGVIGWLQSFDMFYLLPTALDTNKVIGLYVYNEAFRYGRMGYASAVSYLLFVLIFIITVLNFKSLGTRVNYDI